MPHSPDQVTHPPPEPNPLVDPVPYLVEQILVSVAELRIVWGWLGDLVEPGRDTVVVPVLTDDQRAAAAARARAEVAERAGSAMPSTPAGARLQVVDAKVAVHGQILDAAGTAAAAVGAVYVGLRAGDAGVIDALGWLYGNVGNVGNAQALAGVDRLLQRAVRIGHTAARVVDGAHTAPVDHRCPACGRRSLQLDYVSEQLLAAALDRELSRRGWTVACISASCRCSGTGCGCRQQVRIEHRRHAWGYGELGGRHGLWAAIRTADRRRRGPETRVRSESAGNGGWSEHRFPTRVGRAVRDEDGVLWWDRDRACAQLGVPPTRLWDWVRRSAREERFPRLDPPRRDGPVSWYAAEQLLDVDHHVTGGRQAE